MFLVVFYVKETENINPALAFKIYSLTKCVNTLTYNLPEEICYLFLKTFCYIWQKEYIFVDL